MDQLLAGLKGTACYPDIIITAISEREHLQVLEQVLYKLEKAGVRLKKAKCQFLQGRVEYLGHIVDARGLHKSTNKTKALQEAPRPANPAELSSYLGLLRYYMQFLPALSTLLQPLDELKQAKSKWHWSRKCEAAFQRSRNLSYRHLYYVTTMQVNR